MDEIGLIKEKINIVDFISEYIPIKKAGVNFKANCPFHQEKSPSFMISPERGIWHCFGCDKGGDIFKFLMEKEGVEFSEALEILAKRAGLQLKKSSRKNNTIDRLFEANQKSLQFFHFLLMEHPIGQKAKQYLNNRGLTDETIKLFSLGYAPQNWETLTKFLKKRGFSVEEMTSAGLCVPSSRGCYDRFRGRIIFPLVDVRGRVIGFSGRVLDKGEPKYINTPQTPIFDKGRNLYGFNLSKGEVKQKNEAILVEGEMDVIMSYQSGVKNVAASKGTALTEDQVQLIKKYTENISLCFDTDLAGDAAARRGIEIADQAGLNIKVIKIEGGKDPGEVCLKDPKLWEKSAENATPIYDYYLESTQRRFDAKTATGKRSIFNELIPIWKKISDPMTKEHYIQKLSALLRIKDDVLRKEMDKNMSLTKAPTVAQVQQQQPVSKKDQKATVNDRRKLLEEYLISLLLHIPTTKIYVPNFPESLLTQEELKQIYVLLVIFLDSVSFKGNSFKISEFNNGLPEDLAQAVDRLYLMEIDEKLEEGVEWQKELDMVVSELKKMLIKSSLEKLSLEIKNAQAFEKTKSLEVLNKRFRDLSVKLKNL